MRCKKLRTAQQLEPRFNTAQVIRHIFIRDGLFPFVFVLFFFWQFPTQFLSIKAVQLKCDVLLYLHCWLALPK